MTFEKIRAILDAIECLPDNILRPYSQNHVTDRGVNRIQPFNWTEKFPASVYPELFRFSKSDIPTLIAALRIPDVLRLGNGYRTNRYFYKANLL